MGYLIRDGVIIGGTTVYVDESLSITSSNPVENKTITETLNEKVNTSSLSSVATTGDYNDLSDTPTIDTSLSKTSLNAVENKVVTESLNTKYPINYDVAISLADWEALGEEKYYNHKNYYVYDAEVPTDNATIYGWHIDPDESDPSACITYIKDAVGMTPAYMDTNSFNYGSWNDAFFMPKPCMVKSNGIVDYYLNPNDYDAKLDNTTITNTNLPITYNSAGYNLIDYSIYGDNDGSGEETENLYNKAGTNYSNGYRSGYALLVDGTESASTTGGSISEYIEIPNGITNITIDCGTTGLVNPSLCFYDVDKQYISGQKYNNNRVFSVEVPSNAKYVRATVFNYLKPTFMLVPGLILPASYTPYGYKIPVSLESGVTENINDKSLADGGWSNTSNVPTKYENAVRVRVDDIISLDSTKTYTVTVFPSTLQVAIMKLNQSGNVYNDTGWSSGNSWTIDLSYGIAITIKNQDGTAITTTDVEGVVVLEGNSVPTSYIPHRYSTNYNLYIGNTKLETDEYLDYSEQKIYKKTVNLFNADIEQGTYSLSGGVPQSSDYRIRSTQISSLLSQGSYTITCAENFHVLYYIYDTDNQYIGSESSNGWASMPRTFNVLGNRYVKFAFSKTGGTSAGNEIVPSDISNIMLVEGSTVPSTYIPYLQPIDPPVPLPTISTYKKENTLSSTETLGNVSITYTPLSDVSNLDYDGNAMMEWPLIWWKYEQGTSEGEGYFYCSDKKVDYSYNCWCNYDYDNNIIEHFYTAIYNGTGTEKLRSISGIALTNANGNGGTTYTQESTRAMANNTTSKVEWFIDVWSDRMLINGLLILMGKSLNSQAVFGRGLDTGGSSAKQAYITGTLNDKGLFWGVTSAGTSAVKVFGMENWWGCAWHRTAGLIGLTNGTTAYKMTYGTADGTTANGYNTNGNGYLIGTTVRPVSGYFKTAKFGKFGYLPLTIGGSSTTYYSDYWYTYNTALTFALVGGSAYAGVNTGCSYFNCYTPSGDAYWDISSSLSLKPLAELT